MGMKAIDFSRRLLLKVSRDQMTTAQWLALLSVLSGVENGEELSKFFGRSVSTCTNLLRMLEAKGYVRRITDKSELYLTTAQGKARVQQLLTFIFSEK